MLNQSEIAVAIPVSTPTKAYLKQLQWQNQCGFEIAFDQTCMYMRETAGSRLAGFIFGGILGLGGVGYGGFLLTQPGADTKGFGGAVLLIGLLFSGILLSGIKNGTWMIIYDRGNGEPGSVGEIRYQNKALSADRIQCLTTHSVGGNMPKHMVRANLHDGTYEALGPTGVSTWAHHWAKTAADWMDLPYQ